MSAHMLDEQGNAFANLTRIEFLVLTANISDIRNSHQAHVLSLLEFGGTMIVYAQNKQAKHCFLDPANIPGIS